MFSFAVLEAAFAKIKKRSVDANETALRLRALAKAEEDSERGTLLAEAGEQDKVSKAAEKKQLNIRFGYYGFIYPFIKHAHLVGEGDGRVILVAIGSVGLVIDIFKNRALIAPGTSAVESYDDWYEPLTPSVLPRTCPTLLLGIPEQELPEWLKKVMKSPPDLSASYLSDRSLMAA